MAAKLSLASEGVPKPSLGTRYITFREFPATTAAPGSPEVRAEKVHTFLGGSLPLELEGDGDNASHD
jgi:hypothetical protein